MPTASTHLAQFAKVRLICTRLLLLDLLPNQDEKGKRVSLLFSFSSLNWEER